MNSHLNDAESKRFKSSRRFTLAANIMGPVSLFFGGTLLSTIGLIFAILGWRKMRDLSVSNGQMKAYANVALRASKVSIGICAVALVLNFVAMWVLLPEMLALAENGNLGSLQGGSLGVAGTTNSTWG